VRKSARVLVVDAEDKLLLFRSMRHPDKPELGALWCTPGGGIDDGEQAAVAAARELREETGLTVDPDQLGPVVAVTSGTADIVWMSGEFRDEFFFLRVESHDVDTSGLLALEASMFIEYRWWSLDELAATTEIVVPYGLVPLLAGLLAGDRPAEPVQLPWHH
jgi:8-oxo-dGTP pyrophosphatase MutT (NUDIX family)